MSNEEALKTTKDKLSGQVSETPLTRRTFLKQGFAGLAAAGASQLLLRDDAMPTEPVVTAEQKTAGLISSESGNKTSPDNWQPTEENILGPYFKGSAPYRAKISPPLEPGTVLVISGRVWGYDTRKPLDGAVIDIWHANNRGQYGGFDPEHPSPADLYRNRGRLLTDESGYYEYETIHPGHYQTGPRVWRPSHIHYIVRKEGYRRLITQLYFRGDPYNKTDHFIRPSLIIDLEKESQGDSFYERGTFDIVLAPLTP